MGVRESLYPQKIELMKFSTIKVVIISLLRYKLYTREYLISCQKYWLIVRYGVRGAMVKEIMSNNHERSIYREINAFTELQNCFAFKSYPIAIFGNLVEFLTKKYENIDIRSLEVYHYHWYLLVNCLIHLEFRYQKVSQYQVKGIF